jgi:signal transduction histidine kinase
MPPDAQDWPKLLSLAVHELRTPITVVSGYVRMLLRERAGELSDPQRRLLEETERSCARLSALVAELSDLSHLADGTVTLHRQDVLFFALVREAAQSLKGEALSIEWRGADEAREQAPIEGDASRLRTAVASLIAALAREVIDGSGLVIERRIGTLERRRAAVILIADHQRARELADVDTLTLGPFDELRGGNGLALPIARQVIEAHGGRLWSPSGDPRTPAVVLAVPLKK